MDTNLAIAAVNRVADINTGDAIEQVARISGMRNFGNNARDLNRFGNNLRKYSDNPVLKVYGQDINQRGVEGVRSLDDFRHDTSDDGNGMMQRIQRLGADALDNPNRDFLEYASRNPDIARMFDASQVNPLYAQNQTGATGGQVIAFAQARGVQGNVASDPHSYDIAGMSTSQALNMNADLLHEMDTMLQRHGSNIQSVLSRQISDAQNPENARLVANANQATLRALGLLNTNTTP
jgi:hypothetical protein